MTTSPTFLRAAGVAAALFMTATLFQAAPTRADVVFDFSGQCSSGCSGTASGVLTLADSYAFGTAITAADFISMQYSSSHLSFDITSSDNSILGGGGLNADGSFSAAVGLFIRASAGLPIFEAGPGNFAAAMTQLDNQDAGSTFTISLANTTGSAIPEPSTWAMMLLGFAGLGYVGYHKVKTSGRRERLNRIVASVLGRVVAAPRATEARAEFPEFIDIVLRKEETPAIIIGDDKLDHCKLRDRARCPLRLARGILQPTRATDG